MNSAAQHDDSLPFELIVDSLAGSRCRLRVIDSPAGEGADNADFGMDQAIANSLQELIDGRIDANSVETLGKWLFVRLFAGQIDTLYRSSLAIARYQGKRVRLRLRIDSDDLTSLPWELLLDPVEQMRLATAPELSLVRNLAGTVPVGPSPVALPLRLLVITANPNDAPPLDFAGEMQFLETELAGLVQEERLVLHRLSHVTVAALEKALAEFRPHILHFVGHGVYQHQGSHLVLEDEQGRAQLLDAERLRSLLDTGSETRLLVLNACQSSALFSPRVLAELAPKLLRGGLKAIVAMQQRIRLRAAAVFARGFYRNLALGAPIDAAVTEARRSILLDAGDNAAWAAPVLMLYGRDATVFPLVAEPADMSLHFPAPPPMRPPELVIFVGRSQEMEYYAEKLNQTGLAAIVGMAGVGKSSLANRLAYIHSVDEQHIFWHQFHAGERLETVLWDLSAFLAWHGQTELWNALQAAQRANSPAPPAELLFQSAIRLLRGGRFLLWLDDFQYVDDDPIVNHFLAQLQRAIAARDLMLIITSRRMPDAININAFAPLAGLSFDDTQRLLLMRSVTLTTEQAATLHKLTDGNAELLTLALESLAQGRAADELLRGLWEHKDIDRYLLTQVDEGLNGKERSIIEALAVCMGYAADREALQAITAGPIQHRVLSNLVERHLLQEQRSGIQAEYSLHAIVRLFYYHEQLSDDRKRALHTRAAEHYRTVEHTQLMRAAEHYEAADDPAEAAKLVIAQLRLLLNQGHGLKVRDLLARLQRRRRIDAPRAEVDLALAQTCALLGDSEAAHQQYAALLETLSSEPAADENRQLLVRVHLGLGELTAEQEPHAAVQWLQTGLKLVHEDWVELRVRLELALSHVYLKLDSLEPCEAAVEAALQILPLGVSSLRVQALVFLSGVQIVQGKFAEAERTAGLALEQGEEIEDYLNALRALNNLAGAKAQGGNPGAARLDFERALRLAEQLGDLRVQSYLYLNLGLVWDTLGEIERAAGSLQQASRVAQAGDDGVTDLVAKLQMASLYARVEQWEKVVGLDTLDEIARRLGLVAELATILLLRAELALAAGQTDDAVTHAEQARAAADELQDPVIRGIAERLLAKSAACKGDLVEADQRFAGSVAILHEADPFETARSLADWASTLYKAGRPEEAAQHLQDAYDLFVQTGNEAFAERMLAAHRSQT